MLATYVYLVGYTIPLAVTSLLAFRRGEFSLGVVLGIFTAVAALITLRVYLRGVGLGVRITLVVAACVLFVYLALGGGYAGTGLFWCFTLFVVITHFSTAVTGLVVNLLLILATGLLLLLPSLVHLRPDYGPAVISRFLVTGAITSVLLFLYAMLQQTMTARLTEAQRQLLQMSMTDELTGLTNRRSMTEALLREERRDLGGRLLAVVIADVDRFKRINDTLGHDAGDWILRHIAEVLRDALRDSDRVARWGGEEFMMLLDVVDEQEAHAVAERLRATLEASPAHYEGKDLRITASFGVKVVTDAAAGLQDAIIEADKNLLLAKQQGRNRVVMS
jgi:diguanylate cyclase (GGDEF)-like protein